MLFGGLGAALAAPVVKDRARHAPADDPAVATTPGGFEEPKPVAPPEYPLDEYPVRGPECGGIGGGLLLGRACWYVDTTPGLVSLAGRIGKDAGYGRAARTVVELHVESLDDVLSTRVGRRADFSFVNIPVEPRGFTWSCLVLTSPGWPRNVRWGLPLSAGDNVSIVNVGLSRAYAVDSIAPRGLRPRRVCP